MYRFKAFTLDPKRRAVLRDGSPITITPKAFDILVYLVEHPNQVVPKQDLMKAVWPDTIVEEANLTVNMSLLRKALGERDDDRLIVTVARQGYQFTANVTTASPSQRPREAVWAGVGLAALLIGAPIAWTHFRRDSGSGSSEMVRLAVLPFDNLTGDTSRNYLADGLTEELITNLARLEPAKLGVIARTSVMPYRHGAKSLDQIGRDLAVRYAIESSLQQSDNRLRVSVRLIQVDDQRDLWASDFDYGTQDVFHIEDSVSAAVARAVRLRVTPSSPMMKSPDPVAVDEVMRGRALYRDTDTEGGWVAARRYFLEAIARDSTYAPAWAWLAAADRYGVGRAFIAGDSVIVAARAAVDRALVLDPNLPEAWEQRGQIERLIDWDWTAAAASYQQAIALDPSDAEAYAYASGMELTLGHFDRAIALERRAVELDPVDPFRHGDLAMAEYFAGHLDKTDEAIKRVPVDARDALPKVELVDEYLALGRTADAETLVTQQPTPADALRARALVSYAEGQRPASDSALTQLIAHFHASMAYQIAQAYAFRGERDQAFAWMDTAYRQRDMGLGLVKVDPMFAKLHGDPRFPAFLTRMRLPH